MATNNGVVAMTYKAEGPVFVKGPIVAKGAYQRIGHGNPLIGKN